MRLDDTREGPDAKPIVQTRLALGTLVVGLVLMAMMVVVESEPGGLPVLLVLAGAAWYGLTRYRMRRRP